MSNTKSKTDELKKAAAAHSRTPKTLSEKLEERKRSAEPEQVYIAGMEPEKPGNSGDNSTAPETESAVPSLLGEETIEAVRTLAQSDNLAGTKTTISFTNDSITTKRTKVKDRPKRGYNMTLALKEETNQYIRLMARRNGMTIAEFIDAIVTKHKAEHLDEYNDILNGRANI